MIKRIVLTGGPGSGKTTVLNNIVNVFTNQGVKVVVVSETATEVINSGIKCFGEDPIDLVNFQELIMRLQLAKEDVYDRAVKMYSETYPDKDIIVVYDRGAIDNRAYMNEEQFIEVLNRLNNVKSYSDLLDKYDLVIDLVGAKEYYTTLNNSARSEDVDSALSLGVTTLKSWIGHPKIKIVLPKPNMDDKVFETLNYISEILDKKQIKKQKKFLVDISRCDLSKLNEGSKDSRIEQSYLMSNQDEEKRVRKVFIDGCVSYELTVYKIIDNNKYLVKSKKISEKMYDELLEFRKEGSFTILKNRRYFEYNGKYMYLDIFDNEDLGYLEVNVGDDEVIDIPPFLYVIDNVSELEEYSNARKAMNEKGMGLELKKND